MAKQKPTQRPKVSTPSVAVKETASSEKPIVLKENFWKKHILQLIVLAVVSLVMYWQTTSYEYVLDDTIVITGNQYTKKGFAGVSDIFKTESMQGYFGEKRELLEGMRYRPLSIASFAIEHQLFGEKNKDGKYELKPVYGHFFNILWYIFTCIVLYRVLLYLFPNKESGNAWLTIPFLATLLFAIHPLHTEVVANIKGRDEIMTLLGALLSLYFAFRMVREGGMLNAIGVGIFFFLGLTAKENALTFLALTPLTLFIFKKEGDKSWFSSIVPMLVATVFYFIFRLNATGSLGGSSKPILDIMNNPFADMSLGQKLATIFHTFLIYLKLLVFPHPLTHDYYPYHIPKMNWSDITPILSLVLHIGLGVLCILGLRKKAVWAYCIAFYFITFSIVSNLFVSVGTFMNERFIFISSIAFCILIAWFLVEKLQAASLKGAAIAGLGIYGLFSLGLIYKTFDRIPAWKDTMSLNRAAIPVSYNSARANLFMGTAIYEEQRKLTDLDAKKKEMIYESGYYVKRAIEILPTYGSALHMYSGILADYFKYDNNISNLLGGYELLLQKRSLLTITDKKTGATFIDQYLDYLSAKPQYFGQLLVFYNRVVQNFINAKDYNNAKRYLKMGLSISPQESGLLNLQSQIK